MDENGIPKKDLTLKDPNCVYQLMKKHYSAYTLRQVSSITALRRKSWSRSTTLCFNRQAEPRRHRAYAMGWTQHTIGPRTSAP